MCGVTVFWQGMSIVGVILQFLGVLALGICGVALIVCAVCFVIHGIMKFWFDSDERTGDSPAEARMKEIFSSNGWACGTSGEGEDIEFVGWNQPADEPPPAQDVRKEPGAFEREYQCQWATEVVGENRCPCRSCRVCSSPEVCPARKCQVCDGGKECVKRIMAAQHIEVLRAKDER